jgi:hypothetical protein
MFDVRTRRGVGADIVSTAAWLRTVIEWEKMVSRTARYAQQQIRLDEVAWF